MTTARDTDANHRFNLRKKGKFLVTTFNIVEGNGKFFKHLSEKLPAESGPVTSSIFCTQMTRMIKIYADFFIFYLRKSMKSAPSACENKLVRWNRP